MVKFGSMAAGSGVGLGVVAGEMVGGLAAGIGGVILEMWVQLRLWAWGWDDGGDAIGDGAYAHESSKLLVKAVSCFPGEVRRCIRGFGAVLSQNALRPCSSFHGIVSPNGRLPSSHPNVTPPEVPSLYL